MGDVNHLYCARCSRAVVAGFWFSLCGEFATIPRRLATTSSWDDQCQSCGDRVGSHDGLACQVRSMGFVFEREL